MSPQDKDSDSPQAPWMPRSQYQGGSNDWTNQRISNLESKASEIEGRSAEFRGQLRELTVREQEREERRKDQFLRITETQKEQIARVADTQREENSRLRGELGALREAFNALRQDMNRDMEQINKNITSQIDGVKSLIPNKTYSELMWNTGKGIAILVGSIFITWILSTSGISK